MKQRIIAILLLMVLFMGNAPAAYAHDDQSKHDGDLRLALFGSKDRLVGDKSTAFKAIANAAALAVDQFSPNLIENRKEKVYTDLQDELGELHLPKIDVSFDAINLNCNVTKDGKNVTANTHRKYTHMGWNYKDYPNPEFWEKRKQILLHAVNWTLFNADAFFSKVPWLSDALYNPSEQCEAFCAVIYYIHILGDHIEGNIPGKLTDLEPLIQYTSLSTPGIIAELKEQLRIVFISQSSSWTYAGLMEDLSALGVKAEQNCGTWGAVDTVEKCAINQKYAKELLEILSKYLPTLLKKEPFFDRFK